MSAAVGLYSAVSSASGPLRTLFFDDQDVGFWTYTHRYPDTYPDGTGWQSITSPTWPGGLRNDTLTYCDVVHPGQVVEVATRQFYCTGTPQEGFRVHGSNEGLGLLEVYDNGKLVATCGNAGDFSTILTEDMCQLIPMSRGWHVVTLKKIVNAQVGDNGSGARRTYFDGGTVLTRSPTFN